MQRFNLPSLFIFDGSETLPAGLWLIDKHHRLMQISPFKKIPHPDYKSQLLMHPGRQ